MVLTIFIKFCKFIEHSIANNWHYRILSKNSPNVKILMFLYFATEKNYSVKYNWDHKLLIMEITSKLVQWFSNYKHRNKLTKWVTVFWNFRNMIYCFVAMLLNQEIDRQKCIVSLNFSQIRTLSIQCEKVCAVCPYLL